MALTLLISVQTLCHLTGGSVQLLIYSHFQPVSKFYCLQ